MVTQEGINERFKTKMKIPIPAELILVIISTAISHFATLNYRYGMSVIGLIPTGLPQPQVPPFNGNPVGYLADGIVIAVVAFAIGISMAKMMAQRHR
jgi:MFS superfamily sulfate permease-like transporter